MSDHTLIRSHIHAASQAANEASTHANPVIQAAIAQAHALTAIAMLMSDLFALAESVVEENEEPARPLVYTLAHIVGGEILH